MIAIKQNPTSLSFVKNQTKKIVIFAIRNDLIYFITIDKK